MTLSNFFLLLILSPPILTLFPTLCHADNSTKHTRAEQLWKQGQDLYEMGQLEDALAKFKESFKLEPDADKGSYIAWLYSELQDKKHSEPATPKRCYLVTLGSSDKLIRLDDNWKLEVTQTGDIQIFRSTFPLFPRIQIFNDTFECNNAYCTKKIF